MVTQLIKQKDVRTKFLEVFNKPDIEGTLLLDHSTSYNAPLLGNALDYFITCHFNYLKKSETDSFVEKANFWLNELNKVKIKDTTPKTKLAVIRSTQRTITCHFNFLNKKEIGKFIEKTKKLQSKLEKLYKPLSIKGEKGILTTHRTITCHFKFSNENKKDNFREESKLLLNELKNIYVSETTAGKKSIEKTYTKYTPEEMCYFCYKLKNGYVGYRTSYSKDDAKNSIFWGGEIIYCYSNKEISELIEKSLVKYNNYKNTGKVTDDFLNAILILAQILPGIMLQGLAKDMGTSTKNDLYMLKHLINQIPKFFFKPKNVLSSPYLSWGTIRGEPDYIIDDTILDIKTTKSFFSRADYNQLICYYLLYKMNEEYWNKVGVKINKIGIYYSLYGQLIEFKVSDLCKSDELKEVIELIESKSHDTSFY